MDSGYLLLEFRKKFKKFFPTLNPNQYLDMLLWQATRSVKIDVLKLDDWLIQKMGNEYVEGMSMAEALEKHISKEASDFVRSYL